MFPGFARQRRHTPWTIILCVDQSASMLDSVIHAAVLASILASLPALQIKRVVFDTAVVDLSDKIEDPLMFCCPSSWAVVPTSARR